jgi:endoglycosylceramidase
VTGRGPADPAVGPLPFILIPVSSATRRGHRAGRALAAVLAVAAVLGGGARFPAVAAARQRAAPLGHVGRWITDAQGRVVILHGLNMVSKRAPYTPAADGFGAAAAATLADNGFDVVRLGIIYAAVEPRPGKFDLRYLRSIASTVALLARRGVYSLLDFHQDQMAEEFGGEGFPTWSVETDGLPVKKYPFPSGYLDSKALNRAFANFWADKPGPGGVGLQERYAAAWQRVARQFATGPLARWVLGYDLFNEPWPADGTTDATLASFYAKVVAGIRSVDRRHLIWYEPNVLFDFGTPTKVPPLADGGLGMSFHDYCLGNPKTNPAGCAATERKVVANALAHSRSTRVALMMTEFGATDNYVDLRRVVRIADARQLPWIEWAYCGCGDPTGTVPPSTEALVFDPAKPGTGANVNVAKLKVLAEPYPRLVAGTPRSYAFEPGTRLFQLRYSTTGPGGRRFGPGSCTAVVVPPVQYPAGYRVTVNGGRVISRPDAGVLEIESTGRARVVTVIVRPGTSGRTADPGPVLPRCA